jgi:hypothetical protein
MTDVLQRGPPGDDRVIAFEVCELGDLMRRYTTHLMGPSPPDPVEAMKVARLLEDVGNRLCDLSDALCERYVLASANLVGEQPDLPNDWEEEY